VTAPVAPWVLSGESLVALVRGAESVAPLPSGLRRAPGPSVVAATYYTGSPAGPYLELAVGQPARLGLRPGWCFTTMVVDAPGSRLGGRLNWGFPKELGRLVWKTNGDERELRWLDRDIVVRGTPSRVVLPIVVPVRALQRRNDGPVVVPGRLRGLARLTRVQVHAPESDPMVSLAGSHPGVHVGGMRFTVRPARHPVGWASSLRAPLRAPEPALSLRTPGRLAQR
jgi:hypothetical protein